MSAWIRRGNETFRWDLYRRLGRPPVLVPPRWALYERIWEATRRGEALPPGPILPSDWVEPLRSALGGRTVCLVVPDATRVGAWRRLLPEVLVALGERFSARTLLVATGTHLPASEEDLARHLGIRGPSPVHGIEDALRGWRCVQNSGDGFRGHRSVGRTADGTEIRLHPDYLDAEVRVLLGDVSYHYFAGFGGGPKLIFPGCGEPSAAARNHRRALRPGARPDELEWNEDCAPGRARGNPVLTEIEVAAGLAPATWSIVPWEARGEEPSALDPSTPAAVPLHVLQGPETETREESRRQHDLSHRIEFTQRPDLLVVDAGGTPRDDSFLQTQKSLQHARRFVEPGGRILCVAGCEAGTASPMLDRYVRDPQGFTPAPEDLHVQTVFALRSVTRRFDVALWSQLEPEVVRALGLEPISGPEDAFAWMERIPGARWGWLPRVERFLPAAGWLGGGPEAR